MARETDSRTSVEDLQLAVSKIDPTLTATYVRDVTAELIAEFAQVTGDFDPVHVDLEYASNSHFGRLIAHGALLVGFMSAASSILSQEIAVAIAHPNLSLGYDRVRFTAPVFAGDTVTTNIRIAELQPEHLRVVCNVDCRNERDEVVAVAAHIMRLV